ncbi:MAG: hypothetical protein VXW24_02710, partial [Bacteroidota bacterium]|nr:hypothetical protein [Bacteroidota bacterium]
YTEDNIRTLDWKEHIRLRPGMYIGKLGNGQSADDGVYILIKEDDRLQLIPVVVMTTSSLNSDVRSAYKQLANAVVVKPIEFEDYIKTITAIHTFWLSTAKIARYE